MPPKRTASKGLAKSTASKTKEDVKTITTNAKASKAPKRKSSEIDDEVEASIKRAKSTVAKAKAPAKSTITKSKSQAPAKSTTSATSAKARSTSGATISTKAPNKRKSEEADLEVAQPAKRTKSMPAAKKYSPAGDKPVSSSCASITLLH